MKNSSYTFKVIGSMALASVVGASLAILFAPHKGSKTRKKLKQGAKEIAEDIVNKIKDKSHDLYSKAEELEDNAKDGIEEMITSAKHKAKELFQH